MTLLVSNTPPVQAYIQSSSDHYIFLTMSSFQTPVASQGKRELSSPEDPNESKKYRVLQESGSVTSVTLDQTALSQLVTALKDSLHEDIN